MHYELVAYRTEKLVEVNVARLFKKYCNIKLFGIESAAHSEDIKSLYAKGSNVLIIKGYYKGEVESRTLQTVFTYGYPFVETDNVNRPHILEVSSINTFVLGCLRKVIPNDDLIFELSIARLMDSIQSGTPSEEAKFFKLGICSTECKSLLEKLESLETGQDLVKILEYGKAKQTYNNVIIKRCLETAIEKPFMFKGKLLIALIGQENDPVLKMERLLAENSSYGVGILLRYNYKNKKTFVSMAVTKESKLNAPDIMVHLLGGNIMGIDKLYEERVIDGLHFPDALWQL